MQPTLTSRRAGLLFGLLLVLPSPALAAVGGAVPGLIWSIPFAGLLLSIALLPLLAYRLWHRRMGTITLAWSLALLVPLALTAGPLAAADLVWHAAWLEYLPFVILLLALFTAGGGILIEGGPWGRPAGNTLLLAIGTVLAGVMGTTGISMVLIHPLLRSNAHRARKVHLVVFFILLVSNAGGATTPLGDPPLYLGFLNGVPFSWPLLNLTLPMLIVAVPLLAVFWLVDSYLAKGEPVCPPSRKLRLRGWGNVALVGLVVATVLMQGVWQPGAVDLFGTAVGIERLVAMAVLLGITAVSLMTTARAVRQGNLFEWEPMREVAVLFAGIFVTIAPVLAILGAGQDGPAAGLVRLTVAADGQPSALAYFWLTGVLSAFLDNAPTYLIFFQMAGDSAAQMTGPLAHVLQAISAGAVFFGAMTYVGNAPNLMVRSIAAHRGVRMPGFFGYMAWSCALLLPIFVLHSFLFFR